MQHLFDRKGCLVTLKVESRDLSFLKNRAISRKANCTVTPDNQNVMRFRVVQTTVPSYTVSTAARYLVM